MNSNLIDKGYLYSATGLTFYNEALISAISLKKNNPNALIAICTDQNNIDNIFDLKFHIDSEYNYSDKIRSIMLSPFKHTIYLDTDTYINDSIDSIFGLLEYYDLCMTPETGRPRYNSLPSSLVDIQEFNTGVIVYKKNMINELFINWLNLYTERINIDFHDQLSLAIAIAKSQCRVGLLPPEYNFRGIQPQVISRMVKVVHARYNNYSKILYRVNHSLGINDYNLRGWIPSENRFINCSGGKIRSFMKKIFEFIKIKKIKRYSRPE